MMPKKWNLSTITFQVNWSAEGASTGTVTWALAGVAIGDGEGLDVALLGNFGVLAVKEVGMAVVDVTDPTMPMVATLELTDGSRDVDVAMGRRRPGARRATAGRGSAQGLTANSLRRL